MRQAYLPVALLLVVLAVGLTGCVSGAGIGPAPATLIYPPEPPDRPVDATEATDDDTTEGSETPVDPAARREAMAKAVADNARALRDLNWKTRTRLQVDGEVALLLEHRVRHDENGDRQRTLVHSGRPSSTRMGGDTTETDTETAALTDTINQLVAAYTVPPAGMMERFLQDALPVEGDTTEPGAQCLRGSGFLMPEDGLTVWISPNSHDFKRLHFDALLEGAPVSGVVKYRNLPNGPFYPAHTSVRLPGRNIQMTVEHYGYTLRR